MKKIFTLFSVLVFAATMFAQLPYNTTMTKNHFNNSSTVVAKESANWDSGIRLGTTNALNPGNWDDHYAVIALNQQSIPYQLKFKYKVNSIISSNPNWYIDESPDNSSWSRVWSNESRNSSWSDQQTVTLSKSTKYIKLCFSGNYSGTFADIIVSDQSYVNNPKVGDNVINSLDFGAKAISSGTDEKTFDIEWCNVNALTVSHTNSTVFTVTPNSFGGKAKYGTQTVTVAYNRNVAVGEHKDTITISNGSVTKTVTVSGTTTKREQEIHWNSNLVATNFTLNAEDALTGADLATADNEEAVLTYVSDNTDVIAVSEDGKTIYAGSNGTATITVTATGNDIYAEKVESQEFTVTSDLKQIIIWDQNFMSLKTNANPNTIELTAMATSGGEVTYALEDGSDNCVTLNGNVLTITGTPGVAYIIASQVGGAFNDAVWIAASARKQIKARDPQSACDEYALADESFTFSKGDKTTLAEKEFTLVGKPTQLTFTGTWGGLKYWWSEQQEMMVEQYANFGSGLEWRQVTKFLMSDNNTSYGPFALDETATKIRFRSGEYGEQKVSNISIPRKKEMIVSESAIVETAERNVRWSKTISVSRSNIDVVDITVEGTDSICPFEVSKTSIGTDCADRGTETFEVFFTPTVKDSVYTGTITITDGKTNPTTHTISLAVTCTGFNQSIYGFELPATCLTTDVVEVPTATASSELEVVYLSSDSTIAYVENNALVILSAGTVDIIAYQAGDDRYNEATETKTIVIELTSIEIYEAPSATQVAVGAPVSMALLIGGEAEVPGTFSWLNPDQIMNESGDVEVAVLFTPTQNNIYATATETILVTVTEQPQTFGEYTAEFCEGDSIEFAGVWYYDNDETEDPLPITLAETNIYGGDSIVMLTIIVHPKETVEIEETMREKETLVVVPNEWSVLMGGVAYPLEDAETYLPDPMELTLIKEDKTEYGCTKTIIRHIVVTSTVDFEQVKVDAEADKFFQNGTLYIRRGEMIYTISGERVK